MFTDILQFLDGIKDFIVQNLGLTISSIGGLGALIWGWVTKSRLGASLINANKQVASTTSENQFLKSELIAIKTTMDAGFKKVNEDVSVVKQDLATVTQIQNLTIQNSRVAGPETKNKVKSLATSVSGMTKESISTVNAETQEILKKIEVPQEVSTLKEKIQKSGQSILDKYLSEDVKEVVDDVEEVVDDVKEIVNDVKEIIDDVKEVVNDVEEDI